MKYSIIGNPVEHSKSPDIYNYLFEYFGIDSEYSRNCVTDKINLGKEIQSFNGVNITFPYKKDAFKLCDKYETKTKNIGSVNTIVNKGGVLKGINTDGIGFVHSIKEFKNIDFVLIIGAGATAKAASIALREAGYIVAVANRSSLPLLEFEDCMIYPFDSYNDIFEPDLVVNMTSVGLEDDELPFPKKIESIIDKASVCIDLVYGKETAFMRLAESKGKKIRNGEALLVSQAIFSFQYFTNFKYSVVEIEEALKNKEF